MHRRQVLKLSALAGLRATFPSVLARALAIPANNATRSIRDVEHIIFLMQENRSFDHYFGTLRGVRGFSDPRAITLPGGRSVFTQPGPRGEVWPFHPEAPELGLQFLEDLPHDWSTTQRAWNGGRYDDWVRQKGVTTMAHLDRSDIPFHYALADAFTVCDAYHCSLLGPTDPNRYYMWTGWVGNDGSGGGPVVDNAEAGYHWTTFPQRLEAAGISWKVYQDEGDGLDGSHHWGDAQDPYTGNYGDNALLYFKPYREAPQGSSLQIKARSGTRVAHNGSLFDQLRSDILAGTLPSVSWVCAPEAYTEHPNWPANYGAWYISQVLDLLTSNSDVWSKTALFVMFDENDGFFDHMVPPTPPRSREHGLSTVPTALDFFPGNGELPAGPYGLGVRVPMLVISPWSRGGWVNSQVFDHTSLIRFVERRFGPEHPELFESNITPWRRAVAGDLTSAFDFEEPNLSAVSLPVTHAYLPRDRQRHPDYKPQPPAEPRMPFQEPGTRPARPLPYLLHASLDRGPDREHPTITFSNQGEAGAVFQVRSANPEHPIRSYTVTPGQELSDVWPAGPANQTSYDLHVYGPNGFFRRFCGQSLGQSEPALVVETSYVPASLNFVLTFKNIGSSPLELTVQDRYTSLLRSVQLDGGGAQQQQWDTTQTHGWYDLVVTDAHAVSIEYQFAGHIENGMPSLSDPAIGAAATAAGSESEEPQRHRWSGAFVLKLCKLVRIPTFLAFALCVARLSCAQTSLSLPAFTSYAEPNPEALEISEDGPVTNWRDSATHLVWYGQIRTAGEVGVVLHFRLPMGQQVRFGLEVNQTQLPEQTVTGTGELQSLSFGKAMARVAPIRFELHALQSSGPSFGEIDALELSGPGIQDALFNLTPQRGAPSVHLNYIVPPDEQVEWFYGEVSAKTDPIWSYYEVCGFARGYFGMQVNSPTERRIIFSVWDSGKEPTDRTKVAEDDRVKLLAKGEGVVAESFGNEGTGGHSHLVYPWKTGATYRFLVHAKPVGNETVYSGYFYFPERHAWGLIASFRAPKDGHFLSHLYSFDEDFAGANGQKQRLAQFGNEWIRTVDGKWVELTEAHFTHTARGLYKDRIDREAGTVGDRFYLSGGGFQPSSMQYNDLVTRPASRTAPDLTLPQEPAAP